MNPREHRRMAIRSTENIRRKTNSRVKTVSSANTNIRLLLLQYDQAFDRKSWHGTNLRGSARGLSAADAAWRAAPARHNIWEIVLHAAYWKYAVRRRLTGEKRGSFRLKGSNWFPSTTVPITWKDSVSLLDDEHRLLRSVIAGLTDSDLPRRAAGRPTTNLTVLTGIIAHDLYHAGQIQLLKRMKSG